MSNAKQRAVETLKATYRRIPGLNDSEAEQSAVLAVEAILDALGPCGAPRCAKQDESGHCTQSPCIYHSGRGVFGVFINRGEKPPEPCLEPCATTDCMNNGPDGKCYNHGVCEDHTDPAKDACNEHCINSVCEYHEEDGNICLHLKPCANIIPPLAAILCEDHIPPGGMEEQPDGSVIFDEGVARDRTSKEAEEEYLIQGYTRNQWRRISDGGYLCEFTNVTHEGVPLWKKPVARLGGMDKHGFISDSGKSYAFCRPAELPGVLRPWFGGECPVPTGSHVVTQLRNGAAIVDEAKGVRWRKADPARNNEDEAYDVVAYMVLP